MQLLQVGDSPGKSSVMFMPMIDMSPSDMSCIYTTLKFVSDNAAKYGVNPVITFDQPLYWKALTVILNENTDSRLRDVVLRLGGFHTIMSFLGCVGQLMQGSGLSELLETVYASNAVGHMISGKAVARAVRGHLLVDNALNSILVSQMFGVSLHTADQGDSIPCDIIDDTLNTADLIGPCVPSNQNDECENDNPTESNVAKANDDISELSTTFDDLISGKIDVQSISENELLEKVSESFAEGKNSMKTSRTASLWLQYMDMIDILRTFIKAERTGDWELHLHTLSQMLPYFAAAGHNLYLKSAYVYLQMMRNLAVTNNAVFQRFQSGHHVVRRSDRYWAGLSTDLVIEQVLMRSVKTNGGMTRGKGMTEKQLAQWLLSLPSCAEVNSSMQDFCGTQYHTSSQHKECGQARKERDYKDTLTFLSFLRERNPFDEDPSLRNIETGVASDASSNVDKAKDIGSNVVKEMVGLNVIDYSFKRSQKAVPLNTKPAVKVDGEPIHVDPQLLFQRLTLASSRSVDDVSNIFDYELCSIPSALFDPSGFLRQPQKSALADAIWSMGDCGRTEFENEDVQHVIDGGSLIQRIPWQQGSKFSDICQVYVDYVSKKYSDPVIVFDGYASGPSTKDGTHIRRARGAIGPNVNFKESTPFKGKKDQFLTNSENKQRFIHMLGSKLEKSGCNVMHAKDDADLLIVQTAVKCAEQRATMLVGEDTDLLVLLCHHANIKNHSIFFRSGAKHNKTKALRVWDIKRTKTLIGPDTCRLLPFIHAVTGCDTTSRLFGIGKGPALKKVMSDEHAKQCAEVFCKSSAKDEIQHAGESVVAHLYSGFPTEGIDKLRSRKFNSKVASNTTCVQVHTLPPTSAATKYHSMRVYFQVQTWMDSNSELDPQEWGWSVVQNKLLPLKTDLPPAPESLLKIIKCNCKQNCDTKRCTCRKHGLECSIACGECRGVACTNVTNLTEADLLGEET